MAFTTSSVQEVFPGASVTDGELTIPSGSVTSFAPSTLTNPGAYEMVYGLLETMSSAVATGNLSNLTVARSQLLTNNGTILQKTYNFTVRLDFDTDIYNILDVRAEPQE